MWNQPQAIVSWKAQRTQPLLNSRAAEVSSQRPMQWLRKHLTPKIILSPTEKNRMGNLNYYSRKPNI